jgi:N-ethylmaleimide reductase
MEMGETMQNLLSGARIGALELPNRVVMAPMTRARAIGDGIAPPATATYYAQRASAGLIITEGAQISHQARGSVWTPGIHLPEQVAAWQAVTSAVHEAGGRIFLQLWHVGRVSHPDFQDGGLPIAPSTIPAEGEAFTAEGFKPLPAPRALDIGEIPGVVEQYAHGARLALAAGFDGVEIHGANGYLLDQFLRDGSNRRGDAYGGSEAGRARLPLEVVEAVTAVWGADRVGYRMSPWFSMYSMSDSDPAATFGYLARALSGKLGYIHVVEPVAGPAEATVVRRLTPALRKAFGGITIANGGYDADRADNAIASGHADLVSFGVPFIANPDLPARFARSAPLAEPDQPSIYGGGEAGYIDYPPLT